MQNNNPSIDSNAPGRAGLLVKVAAIVFCVVSGIVVARYYGVGYGVILGIGFWVWIY